MKRDLAFCTIVLILLCALFSCTTDGGVSDYVGIWLASNVVTPGGNVDAHIALNEDGTYETLLYDVGGSTLQAGSSRGTYTCANNKLTNTIEEVYDGSVWKAQGGTQVTPYSISGDTLTLYQDFGETWNLTRQ